MTWADAVPNLLIGLREGLEAGLVVSILLAAVRKSAPEGRASTAPLWLGVVGAVAVSGSFAAVLTFSTDAVDSRAQQAIGGILSVLAVGLVTAMIFWMRRTARTLSGDLRSKVDAARLIGPGALALTAFLAVGREGLETTLFLWTAVKASGETVAPLLGAALGLAIAITLCALLYRRAIKINLGVFFSRTALALIVIAAGVLSYGLGDLQDAGLLPGHAWVAFDISQTVAADSWWATIISGVTELAVTMTVLQVVAYVAYLVVVVPAFLLDGRERPAREERPVRGHAGRTRIVTWAAGRPWPVATALVLVPVVVAGVLVAVLPSASSAADTSLTVTKTSCSPDWSSPRSGRHTFQVANKSGRTAEVNLLDAGGAVVGEIEVLGPATTASMTATVGSGTYTFACLLSGQPVVRSAPVQVSGAAVAGASTAVVPVSVADLTPPNLSYQKYAAGVLASLAARVSTIAADLRIGDLSAAKTDWLTAQLDWERVGASYNTFGDAGTAVDGLPDGLSQGVADPAFTGLHRLEYGLWHGQSATSLLPVAVVLAKDVATVRSTLTTDDEAGDPTQLPLRAHEIIEDALRDHLSGNDDQGSGAAYALTFADTQVDRVVLGELAPLIDGRSPMLVATADAQLTELQSALQAAKVDGRWVTPATTPLAARQRVNAAIGALLETLASVPDLLEVPPTP